MSRSKTDFFIRPGKIVICRESRGNESANFCCFADNESLKRNLFAGKNWRAFFKESGNAFPEIVGFSRFKLAFVFKIELFDQGV